MRKNVKANRKQDCWERGGEGKGKGGEEEEEKAKSKEGREGKKRGQE